MNDYPHRNFQNLPKIGPVYSSKDEKQRIIAEEILNNKIKPQLKLKINMNIPGLDKKRQLVLGIQKHFDFQKVGHLMGKKVGNIYIQ